MPHDKKRKSPRKSPALDPTYSPSRVKIECFKAPKTRQLRSAAPHFSTAKELLLSDPTGETANQSFEHYASHLHIAESGVGPYAGNGLYLVAEPDKDLFITSVPLVTYYEGKLVYSSKDSAFQEMQACYTVSLGYSLENAAMKIVSDSTDFTASGLAQFINHTQRPNCIRDNIYGKLGVIGTGVKLLHDTVIPAGHALELVINYGQSAKTIHGLFGDCKYSPKIIPSTSLRNIKTNHEHDFINIKEDIDFSDSTPDSISSSAQSSEALKDLDLTSFNTGIDMPKRQEYTTDQISRLASTFLPQGSYKVISNQTTTVEISSLDQQAETFFFIQTPVDLENSPWFLLYHDKAQNKLYFFDPEGNTADRFSHLRFTPSQFEAKQLVLSHSWFTYSRHSTFNDYRRTGVICIALAQMLHKVPIVTDIPIHDPLAFSAMANVAHVNLFISSEFNELASLLVHYPTKKALARLNEQRKVALQRLIDTQHQLLTATETTLAAVASPMTTHGGMNFFQAPLHSPLSQALMSVSLTLGLSPELIKQITKNSNPASAKKIIDSITQYQADESQDNLDKMFEAIPLLSPLVHALFYFAFKIKLLEITSDEIQLIDAQITEEERVRLMTVCCTYMNATSRLEEERDYVAKQLQSSISEILDQINTSRMQL